MSGEGGVGGGGKNLMVVSFPSPGGGGTSNGSLLPLKYIPYPEPLAMYDEVVASSSKFMGTLEKLHATMGTKFMIPIIGGKDLDLHRLFVEVTSRGGIQKIIRERRWKEVTAVFNFPSTATNASFVLRKYYNTLLHHYEQIYYFGAKGWTPSTDPIDSPSPTPVPAPSFAEPMLPSNELQAAAKRTKVNSPPGLHVVGAINGKFEHGYLVTVMLGTEKLHGVLYHTNGHPSGQISQFSGVIENNVAKDTATAGVRRRRRRRKSEMKKKDPDHPKPNRSGYNFFFAEQHARLKPLNPGKDRDISRMIGELWNKLSEPDKSVYQEKGMKDKERYKCEMEAYNERLSALPKVISDAVPLQQRLVEDSDKKMEPEEDKVEAEEDDLAEEDKAEAMESDDSTLDGSDSEEERTPADKDLEMAMTVEVGNGAESCNAGKDLGSEADGSELQNTDEKVGDAGDVQAPSVANVAESTNDEPASNIANVAESTNDEPASNIGN